MNKDILVIADTQIDNESPTQHLEALSRYIWKHKPAYIVHIGDHWDFPSLSSYASSFESEGRRLYHDLEGGFRAFKLIMQHTNDKNRSGKRVHYKPKKYFLMGNHEQRLKRFVDSHPVLEGCFDLHSWIKEEKWKVYDMNDPLWIEGI